MERIHIRTFIFFTLQYYHNYADLSERIEYIKYVWGIFCRVCLRIGPFSQLYFTQYIHLTVKLVCAASLVMSFHIHVRTHELNFNYVSTFSFFFFFLFFFFFFGGGGVVYGWKCACVCDFRCLTPSVGRRLTHKRWRNPAKCYLPNYRLSTVPGWSNVGLYASSRNQWSLACFNIP